MISNTEIDRIEGATAYDNSGDKVGKIGQLYLDDETGQPSWITVSTGFFGTSETFVPLEGANFDGNDVRLSYDKDRIKNAPRVDADQHLDHTQEEELYRYYGLQSGSYGTETTGYADTTGTTGTTDTTTGYDRGVETTGTTGTTAGDNAVRLSEERLEVGKESVTTGRARLRKYVTTETETVDVPVQKEKLVVERTPVSGTTAAGPITDTGEQVEEITLREERAVVDKETVATEEVRVGKEAVTETQQVTEQVRKEHADIDLDGAADDVSTGRSNLGR